jgi:hypothetical protein
MPETLEMPESVAYTASGEEIFEIVAKLQPALENEPLDHIVMACLAIIMMVMNPNLTPRELSDGVKGASQWICNFMETTESGVAFARMAEAGASDVINAA